MRILFTSSNKIASKLICRVLGEPVSHCALELDGNVIHSNFLGVRVEPLSRFASQCKIWGEIEVTSDYRKMFELMCAGWGKKYDFGALLYLAVRAVFRFLPKKNLWQSTGMFLCTEWVGLYIGGAPDPMATPHQIYLRLHDAQKEVAVVPVSDALPPTVVPAPTSTKTEFSLVEQAGSILATVVKTLKDQTLLAPQETVEKRATICMTCPKLREKKGKYACVVCGCNFKQKIAAHGATCPLGNW